MQHNVSPEEIMYKRSYLFAAARVTELFISFERNLKIIDERTRTCTELKEILSLSKMF